LSQVYGFLVELVRSGDDPGVRLIAALGNDQVGELLTVDGKQLEPAAVYRKVAPVKIAALMATKSDSDE
jgi:hypothetical protein